MPLDFAGHALLGHDPLVGACARLWVRALVVCIRSLLRATVGKCEENGCDENVLVIDFSHAALFLVFYEHGARDERVVLRTYFVIEH